MMNMNGFYYLSFKKINKKANIFDKLRMNLRDFIFHIIFVCDMSFVRFGESISKQFSSSTLKMLSDLFDCSFSGFCVV
jgi:hypothetical protein